MSQQLYDDTGVSVTRQRMFELAFNYGEQR